MRGNTSVSMVDLYRRPGGLGVTSLNDIRPIFVQLPPAKGAIPLLQILFFACTSIARRGHMMSILNLLRTIFCSKIHSRSSLWSRTFFVTSTVNLQALTTWDKPQRKERKRQPAKMDSSYSWLAKVRILRRSVNPQRSA